MEALDYSNSKSGGTGNEDDEEDAETIAAQFVDESKLGQKNEKGIYEVQDVLQQDDEELDFDDEDDEDEQLEKNVKKGTQKGLFSYFKSFATGQREITAETLDPVIATIKEHLITQNVATEIANHLCSSVRTSLMGKKLGSFERISTAVRNSMETALKRILTPKTSLDILRDIEQAKSEKRPYTMCFIGVNGVGKVSSLDCCISCSII